jgi:hypothetical protein
VVRCRDTSGPVLRASVGSTNRLLKVPGWTALALSM